MSPVLVQPTGAIRRTRGRGIAPANHGLVVTSARARAARYVATFDPAGRTFREFEAGLDFPCAELLTVSQQKDHTIDAQHALNAIHAEADASNLYRLYPDLSPDDLIDVQRARLEAFSARQGTIH